MYSMTNFWMKGLVGPASFKASGAETTARFDPNSNLYAAIARGKYGELNARGKVFRASVSAVTIPAIAATLVSVCSLYNPPDSGIDMEVIDTEITQVLATTVVNAFGWYADATAALTALATFTTQVNPRSGRAGAAPGNIGKFYSALTHSGTPVRVAPIGQDGATTNLQGIGRRKEYDGSLILPPGFAMSIAASTAAGTTSGLAVDLAWAEIPIA